jgi:hypothetical protein
MKQKTRRALAMVPMIGALTFGPIVASASSTEVPTRDSRLSMRHERMFNRVGIASTTTPMNKLDRKRMNGMLGDHGKHRGWTSTNPEAAMWAKEVFDAVRTNNYALFVSKTSSTPLGAATTPTVFASLVRSSDALDTGSTADAKNIMKTLRDSGYRFKQLFHQSLMQLFPR